MPRQGPQGEAEGGACCKEVVSAPQILATLPLSYRNTDGGSAFVHAAPLKSAAAAAEVKRVLYGLLAHLLAGNQL